MIALEFLKNYLSDMKHYVTHIGMNLTTDGLLQGRLLEPLLSLLIKMTFHT